MARLYSFGGGTNHLVRLNLASHCTNRSLRVATHHQRATQVKKSPTCELIQRCSVVNNGGDTRRLDAAS
jgi:hypothetical protein